MDSERHLCPPRHQSTVSKIRRKIQYYRFPEYIATAHQHQLQYCRFWMLRLKPERKHSGHHKLTAKHNITTFKMKGCPRIVNPNNSPTSIDTPCIKHLTYSTMQGAEAASCPRSPSTVKARVSQFTTRRLWRCEQAIKRYKKKGYTHTLMTLSELVISLPSCHHW